MGIENVTGECIEHSLAKNGAETRHGHELDVPAGHYAKQFRCIAVAIKVFAVAATADELTLQSVASSDVLGTALPIDHNDSDGHSSRANGIEDGSAS
jgi:hypothetical protein